MNSVQDLYRHEARRIRATQVQQAGWKQKVIAVVLGASKGAVRQWVMRGREVGQVRTLCLVTVRKLGDKGKKAIGRLV